ncbi:MAG: Flp pilus assembly protein CpaB [Deltaproteobacteria bacterium]|nr:Flp pilus assembly protein CpaB [Deltaproteobacteria bacterium]
MSILATGTLLVTALLVAKTKERKETTVTLAEPVTVTLFTPEKSVPIGVQLSSVKFRELIWPRNQVPEDAVVNLKDVLNFYTTEVLEPGPPLRYRQISREPIVVSLPLNPGMRAVSIEVDETTSVEGFARPGTRVDVTLTFRNDKTNSLETRIIVHNARVLSLGGDPTVFSTAKLNESRKANPRRTTLTLEVTPEEALIIQTARQSGRLGLIMRAPEDTSVAKVDAVSDQVIRDPNFQAVPKNEPKCKSGTVKIGDKMFAISCEKAGELIPLE